MLISTVTWPQHPQDERNAQRQPKAEANRATPKHAGQFASHVG